MYYSEGNFIARIVTGLQLVKREGIVHLVISERELTARGGVIPSNPSLATWISNFYFSVNDTDVEEKRDYHKLTIQDSAIDLDVIIVPKGSAVTGARFRIVDEHIRFEIRATQFNYDTGHLDIRPHSSSWYGNNVRERARVLEPRADVPTRSPRKSMRDRRRNTYVQFGMTDMVKDIAQTTGDYFFFVS